MFERAEDQEQSDDGQQAPQASSDEAGMEPLGTLSEDGKLQSIHDPGACGTLEQMKEVQLLLDPLPLTSSTELKVLIKMKQRGRPKGAEKTVIGLPRQRQELQKPPTKLRPFRDVPPKAKNLRLLCCLIPQRTRTEVLQGKMLLNEDQVETIPSRIPETVLDEDVNLRSVQKYFTEDGWAAVLAAVKMKKKSRKWRCNEWRDLFKKDPSMVCDLCLRWFHQVCTAFTSRNRNSSWFCQKSV
ncbi:unnamed protein product [Ixodes persulcatus]